MANGNVDELNIEISAQAQSAVKSLNSLVSSMKNAGIQAQKNVSYFRGFTKELGSMASAAKSLNSITAKNLDFSGVTKSIRAIGKIDASSAQKTADSIKKVTESLSASGQIKFNESGMNKVVNSVRNLLSVDLTKFNPQSFQSIINSIASLGQVPDVSSGVNRLVSSLARLSNAGDKTAISASGISILASETKKAVQQLSGIGSVSDDIVRFVQAIAQLASSGPKASQAAAGLKELTPQLVKFITAMKDAPTVNKNTLQLVQSLSQLSAAGGRVGTASKSIVSGLASMNAPMKNATKSTLSLAAAFGKFYASFWVILRAFDAIKSAMDISSSLTEVQNVVDVTFGDMTDKVEELAQTSIEQFGMSELSLKQYASRFQAMGTAMGANNNAIAKANEFLNKQTNGYVGLSDQMADVSLNLTKLTADMSSFYNVSQSEMATALQSVFTGETEPLRRFGLDLSFATVEAWALANGLNADMQSMTQSEKTMLRYQYVLANTAAAQNDFQRTSNSWANQTRILAQNFEQLASIIGGVFINALKPLVQALNAAMSSIMSFAQTIADALGAIFGWTIESTGGGVLNDMATSAGEVADGLGDAVGQAKKLNKSLQSFNELNVIRLSDDTGGSGGGTGGGGTTGGGSQVNIVQTESLIEKYKSEIENLYQLGEYIGETLTNALNSIDWDSVYKGARNFGKGLADFLNGLISPELFGAVGRTIASALNTAIYVALSFGETFDFKDFGLSIASAINNFFETFDFGALAKTINVWVRGIYDTITTAINNIKWKDVWSGVIDFLSEIDLGTVSIIVGGFALKYGVKKLTASILKSQIVKNFDKLLMAAFGSTANAVSAGFAITATIFVGFQFAKDAKEWWDNIQKYGWDEGRRVTAENNPANPYRNGNAIVQEDGTGWFDEWTKKLKKWQSDNRKAREEESKEFNNMSNNIIDSASSWINDWKKKISKWQSDNRDTRDEERKEFKNTFDNIANNIKNWWQNDVSPWFTVERWSQLGENVKSSLSSKWSSFTSWWQSTGIPNWWDKNVSPWFTKEKWSSFGEVIRSSLTEKWSAFSTWWSGTGIPNWWNNNVAPWFTVNKWQNFGNNMKNGIQTMWQSFTSWWQNTGIPSWWNNNVAPWFTVNRWQSVTDGIRQGLVNVWNNARNWWNNNNILSQIRTSFPDILGGIKYIWGVVKSWWDRNVRLTIPSLNLRVEYTTRGLNSLQKAITKVLNLPGWPSLKFFANGGYPRTADLFWANENGVPELVGTMGGRTAVASGTEITGISDAIYGTGNVEIQLLQEQNRLLRRLLAKDTGISANDLFNSVRNSSKDYTARTGRSAFDF